MSIKCSRPPEIYWVKIPQTSQGSFCQNVAYLSISSSVNGSSIGVEAGVYETNSWLVVPVDFLPPARGFRAITWSRPLADGRGTSGRGT